MEGILESKKNSRPDKIPAKQKVSMVLEYVHTMYYSSVYNWTRTKLFHLIFSLWRYLASGDLQRHIASSYRVGKQTFGEAIDEVCDAICISMKDEYKSFSDTDWLEVANQFNAKWNLPNCVGAIDGKHIAIRCPKNAGSLFYNYKVSYSNWDFLNKQIISLRTFQFVGLP